MQVSAESVIARYREKLDEANHENIILKSLVAELQRQNEILRLRINKEEEKTTGE